MAMSCIRLNPFFENIEEPLPLPGVVESVLSNNFIVTFLFVFLLPAFIFKMVLRSLVKTRQRHKQSRVILQDSDLLKQGKQATVDKTKDISCQVDLYEMTQHHDMNSRFTGGESKWPVQKYLANIDEKLAHFEMKCDLRFQQLQSLFEQLNNTVDQILKMGCAEDDEQQYQTTKPSRESECHYIRMVLELQSSVLKDYLHGRLVQNEAEHVNLVRMQETMQSYASSLGNDAILIHPVPKPRRKVSPAYITNITRLDNSSSQASEDSSLDSYPPLTENGFENNTSKYETEHAAAALQTYAVIASKTVSP